MAEFYKKGEKIKVKQSESDLKIQKFNTILRYVLYRKLTLWYFALQMINIPFMLGVVMTLLDAKHDLKLEDITLK